VVGVGEVVQHEVDALRAGAAGRLLALAAGAQRAGEHAAEQD
jgi:hypothetical protein